MQNLKSILFTVILLFFTGVLSGNDIAKADTFGCFIGTGTPPSSTCNSLPSLESSSINEVTEENQDENKCLRSASGDWHTTVKNNNSDVTVLSIHGGNIEPGTSKISADLESLYKWDRYNFEGHVNRNNCKQVNSSCNGSNFCLFHITSNNFNDPAAEGATGLVRLNPRAVSIHGCSSLCTPLITVVENGQSTLKPDPALLDKSNTICIGAGGANLATRVATRNVVRNYINQYKLLLNQDQWSTTKPPLTFAYDNPNDPPALPLDSFDPGAYCDNGILANSSSNIVNKTTTNAGIQLEISKDIRDALANDSIENDLLRTIVYGGTAKGVGELPLPILTTNGTENYTVGSENFTRYKLKVENKSEYPADLFAVSPNLPPCGLNNNAARTWVNIYNANNNEYIYGFCALSSPNDLDSIWFAVQSGTNPPSPVYITLEDRLNNRIYRSNRVNLP
jgi:phage replication-related protein YjqB (UPF0714/DUF867 family)